LSARPSLSVPLALCMTRIRLADRAPAGTLPEPLVTGRARRRHRRSPMPSPASGGSEGTRSGRGPSRPSSSTKRSELWPRELTAAKLWCPTVDTRGPGRRWPIRDPLLANKQTGPLALVTDFCAALRLLISSTVRKGGICQALRPTVGSHEGLLLRQEVQHCLAPCRQVEQTRPRR
jgi:hypothetical protein